MVILGDLQVIKHGSISSGHKVQVSSGPTNWADSSPRIKCRAVDVDPKFADRVQSGEGECARNAQNP